MVKVDDITNGFILLVRISAVARFVFCAVKMIGAEEELGKYKKRAKNVVLFWILAESIWVIRDVTLYYFQ